MNGFIALFKAGLPEPVVNPGVFKRKEKDVGSLVKKRVEREMLLLRKRMSEKRLTREF